MERMLYDAGLGPVAGVDEAGRGACAGPLAVAACILPSTFPSVLEGLTDSKKLTAARREYFFPLIKEHAHSWSVVLIGPEEIDEGGIQHANIEGMRRAIAQLSVRPGYILTDGFRIPGFDAPSLAVVKGDYYVGCIAAASVLAKVTRDHIMEQLGEQYPEYNFSQHKGYGTQLHQQKLLTHGVTPVHRRSYSNVHQAWEKAGEYPATIEE